MKCTEIVHQMIRLVLHIIYHCSYSSKRAIEHTPLLPTNPYSATKAGAEHLVFSYFRSWNFPIVMTRCNNIYGPHQFPEKVIPKWISLLARDRKMCQNMPCFILTLSPLHGDGSHRRSFLYVTDVVRAYDCIIHNGIIGIVLPLF